MAIGGEFKELLTTRSSLLVIGGVIAFAGILTSAKGLEQEGKYEDEPKSEVVTVSTPHGVETATNQTLFEAGKQGVVVGEVIAGVGLVAVIGSRFLPKDEAES